MNFDSGFGTTPGAESHGGQSTSYIPGSRFPIALITSLPHPTSTSYTVFEHRMSDGSDSHVTGADPIVWVCVAALAILDSLFMVDIPTLAAWLSERQLPSGGLNGRPEKLEDVCYSWWDLASLSILGKLHWINRDKLMAFILESQVRPTLYHQSTIKQLLSFTHYLFNSSLPHFFASSPLHFIAF